MTFPTGKWVDIGERPRHVGPLIWTTYDTSPFTVGEARDMAWKNEAFAMHRHEPDRVVMQLWLRKPRKKRG